MFIVAIAAITPCHNAHMIGLFSASDIEGIILEIFKMMDFHHPNVMSLIGVCLDAGPGISIVMPFMANGSLLYYLKKERDKLYLSDVSKHEIEDVSPNNDLMIVHDRTYKQKLVP